MIKPSLRPADREIVMTTTIATPNSTNDCVMCSHFAARIPVNIGGQDENCCDLSWG